MYIKLIDGSMMECSREPLLSGKTLLLFFNNKTSEELSSIFSDKVNVEQIKMYTNQLEESYYGYRTGYTILSGIIMQGENKMVTLSQEADKDSSRITEALAKAEELATQLTAVDNKTIANAETIDSIMTDVLPTLTM